MTKLAKALNLTPTRMHDENLLHGSKIRELIKDVRSAMRDARLAKGFKEPTKWIDFEKELEAINSETFTTFRDKSLTKLGMKVSAIATEVNKELDPTNQTKANLNRDIKSTPPESALEKCRKSLLSKLRDAKDQIDNKAKEMEGQSRILAEQAKSEQDPVKKQALEESAMNYQLDSLIYSYTKSPYESIEEKVEKETDISKFADYENELNALSRVKVSSQPVPGSPPVKLNEKTFQDLHSKFTTEKERLVKVFEAKKYAWRESSVKELLNLIDDGLEVLADPNASLPQKQVAANLLELRLTELERKLRPLSIPLTVQDLAIKKTVLDDFVKAMDGVVTVIVNKFTVEADKNQINSVLPNAISIAKGPLARLAGSLGKITAATITQENESTVDAYCVQSLRLATQCVEHCASDPLLKAWDQLPDKQTPTSASLKKAIEDVVEKLKSGK